MPPQSDLQSSIPAGRLAVVVKLFVPPTPAFGPGSNEYTRLHAEALKLADESKGEAPSNLTSPRSGGTYAGAGSYF